jgi:transposase-like protein
VRRLKERGLGRRGIRRQRRDRPDADLLHPAAQHHKHLKSTNLLERLNEGIRHRTRVVRIFPNPASCLRLVRALCAETHETLLEDNRYINMELLKEQKKAAMKLAA